MRLTILTGILFLWQYPGAKGTAGHITRLALALFLSVFVVYMNTGDRSQPATGPHHECLSNGTW
jgi:hypothetical protein